MQRLPAKPQPKPLPLPIPGNILKEVPYRGYRICLTDDPKILGSNTDGWGFTPSQVFVVLDDLDDYPMPISMHAFYSPDDAAAAIDMMDTVMPDIRMTQPNTTLLFEYSLMRAYRRNFWRVYQTLANIRTALTNAKDFDENPADDVDKLLHLLRQNVAQSSGYEEDYNVV